MTDARDALRGWLCAITLVTLFRVLASPAYAGVVGGEFQVNTYPGALDPAVVTTPNGGFIVVWSSSHDGSSAGTFGQRYDSTGVAAGNEFQINTYTSSAQSNPDVAVEDNGDFVVVWEDDRDGNGEYQVHGRAFNADGTERIAEFTANIISAGQQTAPAVAMNASGAFLVGWHGDRDLDGEYHVYWRRFTALGVGDLEDTKVDCFEPAQHVNPVLGLGGPGGVLIFWEETVVGQKTQVIGRTFAPPGG